MTTEECLEGTTVKATDETVRLVWEELVETDRMCRYYGYLAHRLNRLGELLAIGTVSFSLGAVLAVLKQLPESVSLLAIGMAAVASVVMIVGRYQKKASRSAEIFRLLGQMQLEWEHLWNGVWTKDDAELRAAWKSLSERQGSIIERAPDELPLSRSLVRRSQLEADRYWIEEHAEA